MRSPSLLVFALFAAACGVGALPQDAADHKNHLTSGGAPCTNKVNGNTTSSTDVDGNIVLGCGNVISNVTNGTAPAKVKIFGSDNVVENDIVADTTSGFAVFIGSSSDTSPAPAPGPNGPIVVTEYNDISSGNVVSGNVAAGIGLHQANGNVITSNNAKNALVFGGATDNDVTGNQGYNILVQEALGKVVSANTATGTEGSVVVAVADNNTISHNEASDIDAEYDGHADVEFNHADYDLKVLGAGFGGLMYGPNSAWNVAPVTASCGGAYDETTNNGDGVTCNVILPPGRMLAAGTISIPGTRCSGETSVVVKDDTGTSTLSSSHADKSILCSGPMPRRSLLYVNAGPKCDCSYLEFHNTGTTDMNLTLSAACYQSETCSAVARYSILGFKTTTVKHNSATSIDLGGVLSSDVIESNNADYSLTVTGIGNVALTNNTAGEFSFGDENSPSNVAGARTDVFDSNHVDNEFDVVGTNITVRNNSGACAWW